MSSLSSAASPSPLTLRERLERAQAALAATTLDGLVLGPGADFQYFLGASVSSFERLLTLVIPRTGAATVVAPRIEAPGIASPLTQSGEVPVVTWVDGEDPYALVLTALNTASPRTIAVDDALPALHVIPLWERLPGGIARATPLTSQQRMVKDPEEIAALCRAGAAIDRVHARMAEFLRVGRTEREVAADIGAAILQEGHSTVDFVIVGSGPHGADPHHEVSDRVIEAGDIVVIDIGGAVEPGYFSDSTRTYSLGVPRDAEAAAMIAHLEAAQAAAVRAVRPGVTAQAIDSAARDHLASHGLAEHFLHRTGHGIGLSVHEDPYIIAGNDQVLATGMAFSIEPGVYLPGRFGARIEDIVLVTQDGVESVNQRPHSLTQLPA